MHNLRIDLFLHSGNRDAYDDTTQTSEDDLMTDAQYSRYNWRLYDIGHPANQEIAYDRVVR